MTVQVVLTMSKCIDMVNTTWSIHGQYISTYWNVLTLLLTAQLQAVSFKFDWLTITALSCELSEFAHWQSLILAEQKQDQPESEQVLKISWSWCSNWVWLETCLPNTMLGFIPQYYDQEENLVYTDKSTRLKIFLNIIKLTVMFGLFPLIEHYSWMQSSDLELDYIYPPVNPILGESICASQN